MLLMTVTNDDSRKENSPSATSPSSPTLTAVSRFRVFFSWQSDLPSKDTTSAIRAALRAAATRIEKDADYSVTIFLDEAVRDEPGSPNIPATIQSKIEEADLFVADVTTTIRDATPDGRCSPNPNVLVELGYAAASLGWSRVVMLFNRAYGLLKELPFDIDRHRVSHFQYLSPAADDNDRKNKLKVMEAQLHELMTVAIRTVIDKKPLRPSELKLLSPDQMRRVRDVRTLKSLFQHLCLPVMDAYFEEASSKYILHDAMYFYEGVIALLGSASFYIHDANAASFVNEFAESWEQVHSFSTWFSPIPSGKKYGFTDITLNIGQVTKQHYDAWIKAQTDFEIAVRRNYSAFKTLLDFVRREYVEIDVEACSRIAYEDWRRWNEKMDVLFNKSSSTVST
jgi:hypothetical protein